MAKKNKPRYRVRKNAGNLTYTPNKAINLPAGEKMVYFGVDDDVNELMKKHAGVKDLSNVEITNFFHEVDEIGKATGFQGMSYRMFPQDFDPTRFDQGAQGGSSKATFNKNTPLRKLKFRNK